MNRVEFMKELENLLSHIPVEEREGALQYYSDYFEDAGEDHEEEILAQLGSPQRIASIIEADLNSNATDNKNRGIYTEKGYQDTIYQEEKFEIVNAAKKAKENEGSERKSNTQNQHQYDSRDRYDHRNTQQKKRSNIGLIILLCIFGFPIIFPLFIAALSTLFAFIVAVLGIVFGFGLAGIVMMGVGAALVLSGLIKLGIPLFGFLMCGGGLLVLGLGMLFFIASIGLCKTVLPAMIRGIVALCRLPFQNRRVAV